MIQAIDTQKPKKKPSHRPVHLPIEVHRKLVMMAAAQDEFIQDIVLRALQASLPELSTPANSSN
jgi:predicted HicB family RNase H-like nuclease